MKKKIITEALIISAIALSGCSSGGGSDAPVSQSEVTEQQPVGEVSDDSDLYFYTLPTKIDLTDNNCEEVKGLRVWLWDSEPEQKDFEITDSGVFVETWWWWSEGAATSFAYLPDQGGCSYFDATFTPITG